MALTTCFECEKEVSSTAKTCPHCGVFEPWYRKKEITAKDGSFKALAAQAKLNMEEDKRSRREIDHNKKTKGGAGCGGIFIAVVLALIFFFIILPMLGFLGVLGVAAS